MQHPVEIGSPGMKEVLSTGNVIPPADFAANAIGGITRFLGTIAPPLLTLAIAGMGLQMIVTGKKPKILGG
jgi:hypothetical protein